MKRSFLFLTGPHSPFFARLGEELIAAGHRVLRINFSAEDKFFWDGENTADYKHPLLEFGAYINNVARLRKITDLVIFGDSGQFTKEAIEALKNMKIRLYVFERGYFGDNWITLEDRVFGSKTVLPKDPRFYLRQADSGNFAGKKFGHLKRAISFHKLQYKLLGRNNNFPGHGIAARVKRIKITARLDKNSYFLADYDLSRKASFMRNFAANAPEDVLLTFYSRLPLSQNQIAKTYELAAKYHISERVVLSAGKAFRPLVKNALGYITNSNMAALMALKKLRPVLALDNVIYNIEGLTSRLPLADFWNQPQAPNAEILRKFKNYVLEKTQVNGCFYNKQGIEMAVIGSLAKILGREAVNNQNEALVDL